MRASAHTVPPERRGGQASQPPVRRAPSPSQPLLPLVVQKSEFASRAAQSASMVRAAGTGRGPAAASLIPPSQLLGRSGGILGLVERGELPPDCDLEPVLTSDGPMRSIRAPIHAERRRDRQPVMTEVSGFKQFVDFKLDYGDIERLPARLNLSELRHWEAEEVAAKEAAAHSTAYSSPGGESASTAVPDALVTPNSALARDDPKTYTELLDLYSMHEFIIRQGKTLRNTPEFASFKRQYAAAWGGIESVIGALEALLLAHGVPIAYIDGKRLAALASYQLGSAAAVEDLVECVANADEVEPLLANATHQYRHGLHGPHKAAAKIQSAWRMYRQGIAYRHVLLGTRAATLIQRQWAIHRAHCATRRTIQALRQTRVARWHQTMAQFCIRWPRIRQARRTILHIPSLSYPSFHARKVPFYMALQLGQLTRLCDLVDPRVDIVMVAPFKPEPEVMAYMHSLLEEAGVSNAEGRFTLLVPEEAQRLPDGMSLTRLVLMSARLMKMLRAICTGRSAFIVPGVVGPEELLLASELNVPMLSPEPHVAQVFGTKSGAYRLVEAAEVPTPSGARQVRSRADLLRALASLMLEHRECPRWLVKLDTEAGSRGHAYFDVSRMKTLKSILLLQQVGGAESGAGGVAGSGAMASAAGQLALLVQELEDYGAKRVRLVHQGAYADWAAYLDMLDTVGACVEAVPAKPVGSVTANLFVEPTGEVRLDSVAEPLLAPAYTVNGCCCPPTFAYPEAQVADAALRIGRAVFRKRVIGYLSVDFVLFTDKTTAAQPPIPCAAEQATSASRQQPGSAKKDADGAEGAGGEIKFWVVDVDLCWNNNAVAHHFAAMLCSKTKAVGAPLASRASPPSSPQLPASPSEPSAAAFAAVPPPPRLQYVYSGIIYNPFIASIRHTSFFSLCRARGIAYDRERQSGVVFHLIDVLLRNCLGVLSVGPDMQRNVKKIADFQSLLNMELPKQGEHSSESNFTYFSAVVRQLARIIGTKKAT